MTLIRALGALRAFQALDWLLQWADVELLLGEMEAAGAVRFPVRHFKEPCEERSHDVRKQKRLCQKKTGFTRHFFVKFGI